MIIAISGKIESGKNTIGNIIAYLTGYNADNFPFVNNDSWFLQSSFSEYKFADTLKNQICSLIGCTRTDLENHEFKNTELFEEWWYYKVSTGYGKYRLVNYLDNNESDDWIQIANPRYLIKPTPRMLLQQIGTDLFRNQLHPNVWVNALFSEYIGDNVFTVTESDGMSGTQELVYPNWIITDMRFPNELKAVKDRSGITIRVERHVDENNKPIKRENEHESETALDNTGFDYLIHNNGSIQTLIHEVKEILILEKII